MSLFITGNMYYTNLFKRNCDRSFQLIESCFKQWGYSFLVKETMDGCCRVRSHPSTTGPWITPTQWNLNHHDCCVFSNIWNRIKLYSTSAVKVWNKMLSTIYWTHTCLHDSFSIGITTVYSCNRIQYCTQHYPITPLLCTYVSFSQTAKHKHTSSPISLCKVACTEKDITNVICVEFKQISWLLYNIFCIDRNKSCILI